MRERHIRRFILDIAVVAGVITLAAAAAARAQTPASPPSMPGMDHAHMDHGDHGDHGDHSSRAMTKAEREQLDMQLDAIRRTTERYRDIENAKKDGYTPFGKEGPLMGEHWYRKGVKEPPEGTPLDLEHPGTLQYAVIGGKRVLVGVAFSTRLRRGDPLPEGFAGPDDHWHQHDLEKAVGAATEDRRFLHWIAERWMDKAKQKDDRFMLTMVHAWTWLDNPDGVFAMHHRVIPYLKAGLPASYANGASEAAARGLDIATDDGCSRALDGELWMANASREQKRALHDACDVAARQMQVVLHDHPEPLVVNLAGERAFKALDAARRRIYTPHQLERIGSVTEMMM